MKKARIAICRDTAVGRLLARAVSATNDLQATDFPAGEISCAATFDGRTICPAAATAESIDLADADSIVLARLLEPLGGPGEWSLRSMTSAGGYADLRPAGVPDRLEPIFPPEVGQGVAVHVPCGGSRIYFMHLRAGRELTDGQLVAALSASPDLIVADASAGFGNTGLIGEYFRDLGRHRREIVVWRENMICAGTNIYLMAEAEPLSLLVSEIMDILRRIVAGKQEEEPRR